VHMRASMFLVKLALLASILPAAGQAQTPAPDALETPIGKIISATGEATLEHVAVVVLLTSTARTVRAQTGDHVYRGDVIQTGRDGRLDITFADGTTFNISSNARMVLDEFVYDPNGQSNSTLFSLTRGTFNFVAGKVAHTGNMKVDTPVGTMGIRGTAPRVEIAENGAVTFSTLVEGRPTSGARPR
jgi:hypothetical protein